MREYGGLCFGFIACGYLRFANVHFTIRVVQ